MFSDIFFLTKDRDTVVVRVVDTFPLPREPSAEAQTHLLRWFFEEETITRAVTDTEAAFHTETSRERRRIRTLMYETDILNAVLESIVAGDVFYDIGANVGVYTCFAGQHADRVVAFEPHEETATRLRENAELNDIDATVCQTAVADYEGTASLVHPRRSPQELGTGEFSVARIDDATDVAEIDVTQVDTIVQQEGLPRPTVAKIDVEGAELRVLDGGDDTLYSCRDLFIEVHTDHVQVDEVTSRLTDAGFDVTPLKERGNTEFLWATTPAADGPTT